MQPAVVKPLFLTTAWTAYFSPESPLLPTTAALPRHRFPAWPCFAKPTSLHPALSPACWPADQPHPQGGRAAVPWRCPPRDWKGWRWDFHPGSAAVSSLADLEVTWLRTARVANGTGCSQAGVYCRKFSHDMPWLDMFRLHMFTQQGGLLTELLQKGRHGDVSTIQKIRHAARRAPRKLPVWALQNWHARPRKLKENPDDRVEIVLQPLFQGF